MRASGKTYDEIAAVLGASKSSVSRWTRDVPTVNVPAPGWSARARATRDARWTAYRQARLVARAENRTALAMSIGALPDEVIVWLGAIAYWCEGTKSKPWRTQTVVAFMNQDIGLIRLFLAFLDRAPVPHGGPRFRVHIHETADVAAAERSWASDLGVPIEDLRPATLKRHKTSTNRGNRGAGYRGCLEVRVARSAALYRYLEDLAAVLLATVDDPGSSNGRTAGFGPVNGGSIPSPGAQMGDP